MRCYPLLGTLLLLSLFGLQVHAQQPDEPSIFTSVKVSQEAQQYLVIGRTPFPAGVKIAAALEIGDYPLMWRKAYTDQAGGFILRIDSSQLRPGRFQILLQFQRDKQVAELSGQLERFPELAEHREPIQLGDELEAAKFAAVEARLLLVHVAALTEQLAAVDAIASEQAKLIKSKQYALGAARGSYEAWLRQLAQAGEACAKYTQEQVVRYQPALCDEAVNQLRKVEDYGRGLHRVELEQQKLPVPAEYQARSELITEPDKIRIFIDEQLPLIEKQATSVLKVLDGLVGELERKRGQPEQPR
jgi:hypothetical protein